MEAGVSEASERWLADSQAWLDKQMEAQRVKDEAAWQRFRQRLLAGD